MSSTSYIKVLMLAFTSEEETEVRLVLLFHNLSCDLLRCAFRYFDFCRVPFLPFDILIPRGNTKNHDLWEGSKSAIHRLPFRGKSDKSDWLKIQNDYSAHAQKIGPSQRSRVVLLTKRSAVLGGKNVPLIELLPLICF